MLMTRKSHGVLDALDRYPQNLLVIAAFHISYASYCVGVGIHIGADSLGDPGLELTAVVAVEKVFFHPWPGSSEFGNV